MLLDNVLERLLRGIELRFALSVGHFTPLRSVGSYQPNALQGRQGCEVSPPSWWRDKGLTFDT
jgi:hypothetical protein